MRGAIIPALAMALCLAGCSKDNNASDVAGHVQAETDAAVTAADDQDLNLDLWLERMEVGSREFYSAREAVVAAIGLKEGDVVADIGAGTGLYSLLFAQEVGENGLVYAEDIEPLFLDLINRRAADDDVGNITAVLGREDDVTLPKESVDVVFIADTYHYFNDREKIMRTIYDALKPGGSLVLVEFDIVPGEERGEEKSHVRFGKAAVISELEFIGFELAEEPDVEGLEETYFIRLKKPIE